MRISQCCKKWSITGIVLSVDTIDSYLTVSLLDVKMICDDHVRSYSTTGLHSHSSATYRFWCLQLSIASFIGHACYAASPLYSFPSLALFIVLIHPCVRHLILRSWSIASMLVYLSFIAIIGILCSNTLDQMIWAHLSIHLRMHTQSDTKMHSIMSKYDRGVWIKIGVLTSLEMVIFSFSELYMSSTNHMIAK
jgi:hypothetical protein